jgi:hypothetical protein
MRVRRHGLYTDTRNVTCTVLLAFAMVGVVVTFARAEDSVRSSPPDTNSYSRALVPEDLTVGQTAGTAGPGVVSFFVADPVVNNTNPNLRFTDTFGDEETSIAVNPRHPNEIVITAFSGGWIGNGPCQAGTGNQNAPLWLSRNGGNTWTKEFTITPPVFTGSMPDVTGAPCDQTVDFGFSFNQLAATFLTSSTNIYSAVTRNPMTTDAFHYSGFPGAATMTNLAARNDEDQPQLLIGRRPGAIGVENVYVAYDEFNTSPVTMRVSATASALEPDPPNFAVDTPTGFSDGFVNPGHRLAIDPVTGFVYSLWQDRIAPGPPPAQNINYRLNRSRNGGASWDFPPDGFVVANANSTQPTPKFCTVNALLGGVDHAAVDPQTGDVVYVYGTLDASGVNQLAMRRLTFTSTGPMLIGPQILITNGPENAAIPSVAVTANGTIGVFYYTCERVPPGSPFPMFRANFAISTDGGATFHMGIDLETFLSPALDNGNPRQRVLGDYMQVKAVGNTFYGSFTGNGAPFGRNISNNDPIFYRVSVR